MNHHTLFDTKPGDRFRIREIRVEGVLRRRLLDLGFIPGALVEVLYQSPLGDPVAYRVSQSTIALRKEESQKIWGEKLGDETNE
ncbi:MULTISPECIES: FeoA family protein [Thermoactinomyces]|jgi:ferrous iron transport protein A|uniref:Ferrous iron transport protein A n=2 Tax=Thermoactinomyces TaxID=2023 RepID=A0A8I1AHS4_THEIN|nr:MULTISPECIES: FeoA family protein [Thermoactinomyces]KFZ40231.1 iron transporter FeoA [Thermoactinomyces sp. Gus2-1]KYQ88025.1 iron transporter FeoA [Thermoactinomyces sp. AS95]MBA4549884.1 ferrous iron transport protein A [Thermoactinomyces intermedius]MBA4552220.1 ferrous iron transport protein A [Thermoactinomyces vulgaris]MBA4597573.1 ferrous iron transport protein A [Thermoactinomyces vulgaris]